MTDQATQLRKDATIHDLLQACIQAEAIFSRYDLQLAPGFLEALEELRAAIDRAESNRGASSDSSPSAS